MRLREGLGLGQERPPPRPAATPATAPSGRNPEAPRELPQVCARNPGTGVREARAIALETSARARAQAGREEKDPAEGLAAGGGVYPSPRPALPRGWTRAPPTSLGRSVSSSTRPARVLPHPYPSPSRTLALLPHLCAGAAGGGSIRAFPQPSGDPGGGGGGGRGALWPGRRRGETKGGRGLKPEPQRGGSRERRSGKLSRARRRAGSRALCAPRASASPAGSPEMHLHQVLTGAVNPGDNCYSVGSVEDVPFTVSLRSGSLR